MLTGTATLTITDIAAAKTAFALGTTFSLLNYTGTWNNGLFTYNSEALADGCQFTDGLNVWQISYTATSGGSNFSADYAAGQSRMSDNEWLQSTYTKVAAYDVSKMPVTKLEGPFPLPKDGNDYFDYFPKRNGMIRFKDGSWICITSHSVHEEDGIGDLTLGISTAVSHQPHSKTWVGADRWGGWIGRKIDHGLHGLHG